MMDTMNASSAMNSAKTSKAGGAAIEIDVLNAAVTAAVVVLSAFAVKAIWVLL